MDNDSQQRGRGVNKHYWTTQEDKALIEALVELSTNTMWRGENGFRNGYLHQLEKMIKAKFPHTTLKAVPNIESRVKLFRTKTTSIADILNISGFVWNNEHSTIECEKSAYDEYVKNHKEAAGLYGKSFPFFNDLAPVFTKDRAQGNARGDLGDDVDQYMHETINLEDNADFSQFQSEEFFMPMDEPTQPPSPIISDNGASSSTVQKKKKRAKDSDISTISENFLKFVEMVGPGFKTMAECAVRNVESNALKEVAHKEVQEKKKLLNQVIFNINGLSEDEALLVMQSLRKDEEKLNMFWDLPDDKKLRFCRLLLGGRDTM